MRSIFHPADAQEIQHRLALLTPTSQRAWGTMTAAQMLAHCTAGIETATGSLRPKRVPIGRLLGPVIKHQFFKDDEPMRQNSPTMPEARISDERNFETERAHLTTRLERFCAAGPAACTTHPHSFFGPLTPSEWGILAYKHLDHHLRQFGA